MRNKKYSFLFKKFFLEIQVCVNCGKQQKRKLSERTIKCDCGHCMDRDLNSAINIIVKFLTSNDLSHQPSLSEESFLQLWKDLPRYTALRYARQLTFSGLVRSHSLHFGNDSSMNFL